MEAVFVVVGIFAALVVAARIYTLIYHYNRSEPQVADKEDDGATVILLHHERTENVKKITKELQPYKGIDQIIVLQGKPETYHRFQGKKTLNVKDYENNKEYKGARRFLLDPNMVKTKYVLFLDDDTIPSEKLVNDLLRKVKENPRQIYGPIGRTCNKKEGYNQPYSNTVLTPVLMTSKEVLVDHQKHYDLPIDPSISRQTYSDVMIKNKGNGEDLLLNRFVVLKYGVTPELVKGKYTELDTSNGYSAKKNHYQLRGDICKLYGD